MADINVKVMKVEDGQLPIYKRADDCCMDCFSRDNAVLQRGERRLIHLGFAMELPNGWEGVIRPRSGMSAKGIDVAIGTLDTNYRGEVMVNIINNSDFEYRIEKGNRICQLAIRPAPKVYWQEVEELSESERNSDGFGSSGK